MMLLKLSKGITDKYSIENNALIRSVIKNPLLDKYKGEPKDEIKITLGDKDKTEFTPDIELKRWNEVSFKIKPRLSGVLSKDKKLKFEGEKVKFNTPKISFEMYDYTEGEGGFKFVWYLNEKPTSNKVELDIEISGLDFFFQPPLIQEYQNGYSKKFGKEIIVTETQVKDLEGKVLMERPENVVGSYAVYHQTKGGLNDINGKEYKSGKAFHIYRPKLIDADGKETWGILKIENGIYSVEIPQEFLDNAVYPIKSNDTFGYTSAGESSATLNGYRQGGYYTAPGSGTLDSLSAYLAKSSAGTYNAKAFVNQKDSGGTDLHGQIATKENTGISITAEWKDFTLDNESITDDIDYIFNVTANALAVMRYDSVVWSESNIVNTYYNEQIYASPENPWSAPLEVPLQSDWSLTPESLYEPWEIDFDYYSEEDIVSHGGKEYTCILEHISSANNEPGVGVDWETYWSGPHDITYKVDDVVKNNYKQYFCIQENVPSSSSEPGVGGEWTDYWDGPYDIETARMSIYCTYTAGGATEYTATCTETLTTSDTTTKLQGLSKTFFDIFTPSDTILKSQGMVKTLSEILTPTEITISNVYQGIKTFVEDVVMSDIISVGRKFSIVLSDIIYIEKKVFEEFTATLSEVITTTDATISKTWNSFKTLTETLILSDTLTKASSFIKSLTETITISDILSKIEISILTLSENIGLTDVISKTTVWVKSLIETITPSDVLSKITAFGKTLSEIITATEDWIITEINAFVITLTETLNLSDTLSKIKGIYKTLTETFNLTDILTKTSNWIKTFTETFTLSDIFNSVKVGLLNLSETIGFTDTLSKLTTWAKTFSESTTISDSLSKVYGKLLILIETITLSDTITTIEKKILNLIETLNISDTLSKLTKWAKSLTEIAIVSDIITIGGNWWNGITKNISSWTHGTKHTSTWTEDTKHSSNWTYEDKSN